MPPPLSLDRLDFLCQIDRLIGDAVNKDSHHFFNLANFGLTDTGKLKILDYGSPQTQEIIVESGDEIVRNFDPKFRRKKTDKKT